MHPPFTQTVLQVGTEQSGPDRPDSHKHYPSLQIPAPEQSFKQGLSLPIKL